MGGDNCKCISINLLGNHYSIVEACHFNFKFSLKNSDTVGVRVFFHDEYFVLDNILICGRAPGAKAGL